MTRTAICGDAISWRKQSLASAEISANGSRAISAGASLRATATATSTASHSSRVSIAVSARWPRRRSAGDAFEGVGDAAVGFDLGVGLRLGIAAAVRGDFRLGELDARARRA